MRPPSLLLVVTRATGGGAQRYVLAVARAALARGWTATVAAGPGDGTLESRCRASGIPFRTLPSLGRDISPTADLRAVRELRRLVRELRPDVLHANSSKAGLLATLALVGMRQRPKSVFTAHGWVFLEPNRSAWFYRWLERIAGLGRDATIVLSPQEREAAVAARVAPGARIHVIPNGIAPAPHDRVSARAALAQAGVPTEATVVGCVANFFPTKNVPALVRAFRAAAPTDAHLVLIGDGEERAAVDAAAGERVHPLGHRDDARALMDGFDLFILPSKKEGLPFALLEAMEAGLPCLATAVGGVPSVIADGMNGWLTAPDRLEEGLRRAFAARDAWPRVGKAAAETAHALFTEERMVRETFALYGRLTGASAPG